MSRISEILLALLGAIALCSPARAHCDTTRGPVVMAARAALEGRDPGLVLHWVRPDDEAAVRQAFQHALDVRVLGPEAKTLADRYFFETLVRIHRAGEGAPYTGLTDGDPEPIIATTDEALSSGSARELEEHLVGVVRAGLSERFTEAHEAKDFRPGDVTAGRAFVARYVRLTHWVEGVSTAATGGAEHHTVATGHPGPTHPVGNGPDHPPGPRTDETRGSPRMQQLPWILAGVLAIAALLEGALLVRRRKTWAT